MTIYTFFDDQQDKVKLDFDAEELCIDCTRQALKIEGLASDAEVSLTFTDNEGIRQLNAEYRDIDKETDVLSFPLGDEDGYEINPDTDAILLGDIVISLEKAKAQAEEYGHSMKREVAFLITHSILHLMGYDHMTPEEEERMCAKQELILTALDITR